MGRYRFLLRPRWLLISFVAALLAFTMINLGLWQLRRLDEKRTHNHLLDARAAAAVVDVGAGGAPAGAQLDELAYRTGVAEGTYQPAEEVLVRSRTLDGDPGAWVLTPLRLADGSELVVNRGWIPASGTPELPPTATALAGSVTVRGLLMPTQERGSFGPRDPAEGHLATLARADLGRLQAQVEAPLYPLYLQLQAQDPAPGDLPVLLPAPERSEGPHLSYAVQWFLFTVIGLVSYALLVRRTAREKARDGEPDPSTEGSSDHNDGQGDADATATVDAAGGGALDGPAGPHGAGTGRHPAPPAAEAARTSATTVGSRARAAGDRAAGPAGPPPPGLRLRGRGG
jgi:surfeit locus 1 family protein